jgi:hypothetical protein
VLDVDADGDADTLVEPVTEIVAVAVAECDDVALFVEDGAALSDGEDVADSDTDRVDEGGADTESDDVADFDALTDDVTERDEVADDVTDCDVVTDDVTDNDGVVVAVSDCDADKLLEREGDGATLHTGGDSPGEHDEHASSPCQSASHVHVPLPPCVPDPAHCPWPEHGCTTPSTTVLPGHAAHAAP